MATVTIDAVPSLTHWWIRLQLWSFSLPAEPWIDDVARWYIRWRRC